MFLSLQGFKDILPLQSKPPPFAALNDIDKHKYESVTICYVTIVHVKITCYFNKWKYRFHMKVSSLGISLTSVPPFKEMGGIPASLTADFHLPPGFGHCTLILMLWHWYQNHFAISSFLQAFQDVLYGRHKEPLHGQEFFIRKQQVID